MRLSISKIKNWRKYEIQQLRELINTMSNDELAQYFNVPIHTIVHAMSKYKIQRNPDFVTQLKTHAENNNPNWKGGISKDGARYSALQRQRHPEHKRARDAVYRALKDGTLIKPLQCQECGEVKSLQGHHESYEESKFLQVEWVCRKCHRKKHGNLH